MPSIHLIRHGHAGHRSSFDGPDRRRPLTGRGEREAVAIARRRDPKLIIDGEMQVGVALSAELLKGEFAFSTLGKPANVLIFPSIEAGHIGYRLAQELAQADIVGPMFVGLRKPAHIVNRGDHVRDIVNLAAFAVVEAQTNQPA